VINWRSNVLSENVATAWIMDFILFYRNGTCNFIYNNALRIKLIVKGDELENLLYLFIYFKLFMLAH
jgi:hypothetical protein